MTHHLPSCYPKAIRFLLIRAVEEEEAVDDQYLPSPASTKLDLGHLSAQLYVIIKYFKSRQVAQLLLNTITEREVDLMLSLGITECPKVSGIIQ